MNSTIIFWIDNISFILALVTIFSGLIGILFGIFYIKKLFNKKNSTFCEWEKKFEEEMKKQESNYRGRENNGSIKKFLKENYLE